MKKNKKRAQNRAPEQPAPPTGRWAKIGRVVGYFVAFILFLVAILGLGSWLHPTFDPFGWKESYLEPLPPVNTDSRLARHPSITLVANRSDDEEVVYEPFGPNLPTPVDFNVGGTRNCLIRKAAFTYSKKFKTPPREVKTGALVCLPINFHKPQKNNPRVYTQTFRPPVAASADDFVAVEVAVIDRRLVGWSCIGTLRIYYNDNKFVAINNVVVDVLAATPKPLGSRD